MITSEMTLLLRSAVTAAQGRARKRNEPFELTLDFIKTLFTIQNGRCALSGLIFHSEVFSGSFVKRPFAPSIDRIDCTKFYTKGNIQLVCTAVNFARGQWGNDVLRQIAYGIVEEERRQEAVWFSIKSAELAEAQQALNGLKGVEAKRQKYRIAGLKANLTKGPSRLRSAARRAKKR